MVKFKNWDTVMMQKPGKTFDGNTQYMEWLGCKTW